VRELLTGPVYRQVLDTSLRIYDMGREQAARAGIILADTKFEFGLDEAGRLHLIDEVMTPDSSRFWPADEYQVGRTPPSFDKQYVRDYLDALAWDKRPPAPALPPEVVEGTRERYMSAARKLIG
jgi:phosphoribosylaminoimidazole-succinocarboxamide synthase